MKRNEVKVMSVHKQVMNIGSGTRSVDSALQRQRREYVPPHMKLYNSRHKLHPKHVISDTSVDVELIDESSMDLLGFNVPLIKERSDCSYRNCSSVFSLHTDSSGTQLSEEDGTPGCGLEHAPDKAIKQVFENNFSVDSMSPSIDIGRFSSGSSTELLFSLDGYTGRQSTLPPRPPQEDAKHRYEINNLRKRIERTESNLSNEICYKRRRICRRGEIVADHWRELSTLSQSVWLIQLRQRGLQWDGIPWVHKRAVYSMCLRRATAPADLDPVVARLSENMRLLFFERTDEIVGNFYRDSQWWQYTMCSPALLVHLEHEYPSLFYHLRFVIRIDIWREFLQPLAFYAISNSICNAPRDFPAYEDWLLKLFDGLVISVCYHELDSAWTSITEHLLRQNHYKFFGDVDDIQAQLSRVQLDIHGLLEWLRR
ncbi:AFR509Wp [Eremothecium gossypii ATCC 10895]|uniref:AFR509Wp n=1 Tax=Eremothecium gossypii (strain ATCC 10895 / CBS 109.51 / FGSC 9923 / NRRL Y-1056) TaxID=284811 RepID=Q752R4_EREGS|nr:AFR509Wp [Eremothecium gossypii ATCC 10895]AAS53880.1 AFR509Wp [Eremothecium gossypii ATCC 10895]